MKTVAQLSHSVAGGHNYGNVWSGCFRHVRLEKWIATPERLCGKAHPNGDLGQDHKAGELQLAPRHATDRLPARRARRGPCRFRQIKVRSDGLSPAPRDLVSIFDVKVGVTPAIAPLLAEQLAGAGPVTMQHHCSWSKLQ